MFYYIYQITNIVNGKIYVGVHKTSDMNDGYMGSGKIIKAAIKKYGLDNFTKDILEMFDDSDSMYTKEKEVVTDEFLLREDTYNLRRGGTGGFDWINKNGLNGFSDNEVAKKARLITNAIHQAHYGDDWRSILGQMGNMKSHQVVRLKSEQDADYAQFRRDLASNASKAACNETSAEKRQATFAERGHSQGIKNSQYGKMWIYNSELHQCITILNTEPIPRGWVRGKRLEWYVRSK